MRIFLFFGGGEGVNKVHYGLCENGDYHYPIVNQTIPEIIAPKDVPNKLSNQSRNNDKSHLPVKVYSIEPAVLSSAKDCGLRKMLLGNVVAKAVSRCY